MKHAVAQSAQHARCVTSHRGKWSSGRYGDAMTDGARLSGGGPDACHADARSCISTLASSCRRRRSLATAGALRALAELTGADVYPAALERAVEAWRPERNV